MSTAALNVEV